MSLRLLTLAAPVVAGLGVMAATAAPASAGCYYDAWGSRICSRPHAYYAPPPPPPVYYAPPRYYAPPPRVVVAPRYHYRPYRHHYHARPTFHFGFGF